MLKTPRFLLEFTIDYHGRPQSFVGDPKKFIEDPQHFKGGSYLGSLINFLGSLTRIWGLQYMWISNEKFRVSNLGVKILVVSKKKSWVSNENLEFSNEKRGGGVLGDVQ